MNSINHVVLLVLTSGGDGEQSARWHGSSDKDW